MNRTETKASIMVLVAMLLASMGAVLPPAHAYVPSGGTLYIDPDPKVLVNGAPTTTFYLDVKVKDVGNATDGCCGYQLKITWNSSVIKGKSASLPAGYWFAPPAGEEGNINLIGPPTAGDDYASVAVTVYNLTRAKEKGYLPKNESGTVLRVLFEVVAPAPWKGFVDTNITFVPEETIFGDSDGVKMPQTLDDGYYKNEWGPPGPVHFKVDTRQIDPTKYVAKLLNEEFEIDIKLQDVDAAWHLVGFQFKLHYNTTLLEVLEVKNGTFLEAYAGPPNEGVFYIKIVEDDYVMVGGMILPNSTTFPPTWYPPFPSGEGVIATIKFKAILQGMFPVVLGDWLDLDDAFNMAGDETGESIPVTTPARDAWYEIKAKVLGRMIDVYMGSDGYVDYPPTPYPDPYGGQGLNETADLVYPQKKIWLWANVSYNEWPEQQKVVTFEVRDPQGELVIILSAETDENGTAFVDFRIPWPEYRWALCGVFTVVASVDIASQTVKDWLWFHYDWVVRWVSVTTDKAEYKHCEYINITVNFKSKAILTYPVVITIVLKDELQYPFGMKIIRTEVGGAEWCHYANYTVSVKVHVHKHVRAGTATIHVNALSELPWFCGAAWTPEYVDTSTGEPPTVSILAAWA